jgi:exosome complex RNA-binding protein Rrp4
MQVTPVAHLTRLPAGPAAAAAAAATLAADNGALPPSLPLAVVGDALDAGGAGDDGLLRGHGTMAVHPPPSTAAGGGGDAADSSPGGLAATLTGAVSRVDRLVSVRPLAGGRYTPDLGDVVLARVLEVGGRRWRLDVGGRSDAALLLAAAGSLPGGGASRRKTAEDEAAMRALFAEGDLLAAEVQATHADGSLLVHTRSKKYGRLAGGQLVCVRPASVRRCPRQFNALPAAGVDVILGLNGWVWVAPAGTVAGLAGADGGGGGGGGAGAPFGAIMGDDADEDDGIDGDEDVLGVAGGRAADPYPPPPPPTPAQRAAVARAAAAVRALAAVGRSVDPAAIEGVVAGSAGVGVPEMGEAAFLERVAAGVC